MDDRYAALKLENQLCFPLYACAREVVKKYRPHLDKLNLTYTQYIAMMVLWEKPQISVKELGEALYLDSGTLTPLLKSMESKGFVRRSRSSADERVVLVEVTDAGRELREAALDVPQQVSACIRLDRQEALQLHQMLHKLLNNM